MITTQVVGFMVHGGRFLLLRFLGIVDETTNHGTGSRIQEFEFPFSSSSCILAVPPVLGRLVKVFGAWQMRCKNLN